MKTCSTCGNPAVRLLGGVCTACSPICLGRAPDGAPCVLEAHHPVPCASHGAAAALAQVTEEITGRITFGHEYEGEKTPYHQVTAEARAEEPPMLPASIDALIEQIEGAAVDFGAAELNSMAEELAHQEGEAAKRALRAAIRAELDAAEKRDAAEHEEAAVLATMADDDESAAAHREQARALRSTDVCGVRQAAWAGMTAQAKKLAWGEAPHPTGLGPLCIPCPGCGHFAGSPCRETPVTALDASIALGPQSDPTALLVEQRDAALVQLDVLRAALGGERERCTVACGALVVAQAAVVEERKRFEARLNDLHMANRQRDEALARAEAAESALAHPQEEMARRIAAVWAPTPGHCERCDADPCVCHEAGLP